MYQRLDILLIVFRIEFVSLCCRASLIHVKMSKRKICNLDTKIKILKELEKNVKQCDVAKQIESVYLKNINQKKLTDYFTVNI